MSRTETWTGAEVIAERLDAAGVTRVYGIPGLWVMPLWHALTDAGINLTLARQELGAAYAADGHARVSGELGVVVVNSGPGATNLLTGAGVSWADSVPLLLITPHRGRQGRRGIGEGAGRSLDIRMMFQGTTKGSWQPTGPEEIEPLLDEAIHTAVTGRPGPVHLSVPSDLLRASVPVRVGTSAPSTAPSSFATSRPRPARAEVEAVARALGSAERPLVLAGAGLGSPATARRLLAVAESFGIPVAGTSASKRYLDEHHPLVLGPIGPYGRASANQALYMEADRVLVLGAGRALRAEGDRILAAAASSSGPSTLASLVLPEERLIEVDANLGMFLEALEEFAPQIAGAGAVRAARLRRRHGDDDVASWTAPGGMLHPQHVCEAINAYVDKRTTVIADLPLNAYWVLRYVRTDGEDRFVMNTGFGAMGYAAPAGLGAWLARTGRHGARERVVVTTGDGGLFMSIQEISTAVAESAAVTYVVFNNATLGVPRVVSDRDARPRVAVDLPPTDYVGAARSFGADGRRVTNPAELAEALEWAVERRAPTVVDAVIDPDALPTPFTAAMPEQRLAKPNRMELEWTQRPGPHGRPMPRRSRSRTTPSPTPSSQTRRRGSHTCCASTRGSRSAITSPSARTTATITSRSPGPLSCRGCTGRPSAGR